MEKLPPWSFDSNSSSSLVTAPAVFLGRGGLVSCAWCSSWRGQILTHLQACVWMVLESKRGGLSICFSVLPPFVVEELEMEKLLTAEAPLPSRVGAPLWAARSAFRGRAGAEDGCWQFSVQIRSKIRSELEGSKILLSE